MSAILLFAFGFWFLAACGGSDGAFQKGTSPTRETPAGGPSPSAGSADQARKRPVTTLDLLGIRDVSGTLLSPDGRWVAYRTHRAHPESNDYDIEWHVVAIDGEMPPVRVADGGDAQKNARLQHTDIVMGSAAWSPDPEWLVFPKYEDGEVQLWRAKRDGAAEEQLTHNASDVLQPFAGELTFAYSDDGDRILFRVLSRTREERSTADQAPRSALLTEEGIPAFGREEGLIPDPLRLLLPPGFAPDDIGPVWTYVLGSRKERRATSAEVRELEAALRGGQEEEPATEEASETATSPDGRYTAYAEGDPEGIPDMDLYVREGQGRARRVAVPALSAEQLRWSDDSGRLFFTGLGRDYEKHLYALRAGSARAERLDSSPCGLGEVNEIMAEALEIDRGATRAVTYEECRDMPSNLVAVDLKRGETRRLTDLNPGFRNLDIGRPRVLTAENEFGDATYWLRGRQDDDPTKSEQYRRWQALRSEWEEDGGG